MSIHAVNERDVEMIGHTKYLHRSKEDDKKPGKGPGIMIRFWGPGTDISVHSHPFNEMFYVLDGELEMGGTPYPAGSCIYIPKGVEYGPTRAPKGAKVLRYSESR